MSQKAEIKETQKASLIIQGYLIHNKVPGFSHTELKRLINNLAKLEGVLENRKTLIEWTEKNILTNTEE